MKKLSADKPLLHPGAKVAQSKLGRFVEIGQGARVEHSEIGDYSYCERFADIANATIGKFSNIASFARIGPTDHPMDRASLHHFMYRSPDYWPEAERDEEFFARRHARRATVGHDTWIGHGAVIRPDLTIGHGAVVGAMAMVTKSVEPYTIVAGNPARVIRRRHPEIIADRLLALAWWDWSHEKLGEALNDFRWLTAEQFLNAHGG